MAGQSSQGGSRSQEFTIVPHCDSTKKVSIMQFVSDQVDRTGQVMLARENNLKEFKTAHNIDAMPTTGAGSEFAREAKDEARRRKFGYIRKKYNPEAQPWLMTIGAEKNGKKLKGTRNGGILENASYFVFSKRKDGTFEALPVEEWYNFKPTITYSNLDAEEAEKEFARRDKHLNLFNIMLRKRIKNEDVDKEEDSKEDVKKEIKTKGLMLTEMEEWADMSDEDGAPDARDSDDSISGKMVKGKGKSKKKSKKEKDSDEEAVEDSDDGDQEAKQVDYMSDTSDSDSDMEGRVDKSKYEEKGVEDEEGLRNIVVESDSDKENPEENPEEQTDKEKEKAGSGGSSSSETESDDPDEDSRGDDFTKAFLMTGSKKDRGKSPVPDDRKRKLQASPRSSSPLAKKVKSEAGTTTPTKVAVIRPLTPVSSSQSSKDALTEDSVRRYLLRKPLSSKDLFKLFKQKKLGLSNEEIMTKITQILVKLKAKQQKINGSMYFSISE